MARVRIVNDSIVGRYQSLMNAGAFVPRFITKLTSITNARVREVPGRPQELTGSCANCMILWTRTLP